MFQITQHLNTSKYFIGLTDVKIEGTFVWESGHVLTADVETHWKSGQPNGDTGENCVGVKDGVMWDVSCVMALPFVCQKIITGMRYATSSLCRGFFSSLPMPLQILPQKMKAPQITLQVRGMDETAELVHLILV